MYYNYESIYVNKNTGFMFRYICFETEHLVEHWHDYFEIFLLLEGSVTHCVNGKEQVLDTNSLVFIRPGDIHKFICNEEKVRALNLAISKHTMHKIIDMFEDSFNKERILERVLPPIIKVSDRFKNRMLDNFQKVGNLEETNPQSYIIFMRTYLSEILSRFLLDDAPIEKEDNIPEWLVDTCKKMYMKENFVIGYKRMVQLSGKTHEHLGRTMKKYMNTNANDFVLTIRLEHASNMLKNSNMSISQVCQDCGIDSPSYFSLLFKKRYGISPSDYRKNTQQIIKHSND